MGEPVLRVNDAEQNYENVIADNDIHDLGLIYAPAVGIWVLQSGRNQIFTTSARSVLHGDFGWLDMGIWTEPVQGQSHRF